MIRRSITITEHDNAIVATHPGTGRVFGMATMARFGIQWIWLSGAQSGLVADADAAIEKLARLWIEAGHIEEEARELAESEQA